MNNKLTGFIIIVVAIVAVAGGALALGRPRDNSDNNTTSEEVSDDGSVQGASTEDQEVGQSTEYKEALAKFLTAKGAVLYGAYWCPHCKDQKNLFGDALKYVNYVECDANGENANPDECTAKDIKSYPTWIYQGKQYSGTKSLSDLAQMVGFSEGDESQASDSVSAEPDAATQPESDKANAN